jgi:putative transposase
MMSLVSQYGPTLGIAPLCHALNLSRADWYRNRQKKPQGQDKPPRLRTPSSRALSSEETQQVLDVLHEDRFVDQPPAQVYAALLDEGRYLCSERTMYRILHTRQEVRERRNQCMHPVYVKPELLAQNPNEVWSWDITKLKGPVKWTYYYLYVILDIYSRYAVGWTVAACEQSSIAKHLIAQTVQKQNIGDSALTLHADRGSSMKSKCLAQLLSDLGITKTHSRPHVSNDNPFSESQFKTLKYRPQFPDRFGSIQDARAFCVNFFDWYNTKHHHSALGLLTPQDVHYGRAQQLITHRQHILNQAYARHPERFIRKPPQAPQLPQAVWINPPTKADQQQEPPTPNVLC